MENIEVICFGGNDWWYHNRNHFDVRMMEQFAKFGNVLYVNSIIMQKPNLSQGRKFFTKVLRKTRSILKGLQKVDYGFMVCSPLSLPFYHITWMRSINEGLLRIQLWQARRRSCMRMPIVWVACPTACDVAVKMRKSKLVYQRTDRYEEYPNVDRDIIKEYDQKLKTSADLTVFVSHTLYEQEQSQCRRAFFLDHGVDYEMFAGAEHDLQKPKDIVDIAGPIVGFFGGIDDHTSDISFMERVVDLLPEMSFVFVGRASSDCLRLMSKKNVRMLGQKPYEKIPHYGKCFDVTIMPWRQNRWIEACNPIKLKEYLALGKPIVSTPFPELQQYLDVVYQARTPEQFAECIQRALAEDCAERIAQRREKVQKFTWESKAQLVLDELFAGSSGS